MVTLNAHFDGKVIVPDQPLDLPANQKLRISIEPIEHTTAGPRVRWQDLIGIGLPLPESHSPRYANNDDLWDKEK